MIAAAFDDRLMGAPVVTGGGGVGAYRFAGPRGSETLDIMQKKYPTGFLRTCISSGASGKSCRSISTGSWRSRRRGRSSRSKAIRIGFHCLRPCAIDARRASRVCALWRNDRLGVNFSRHGHAFTPDDWTAMLDFFDKHLRAKPTDRTFDRFPTEQELDAALAAAKAAQ